MPDSSTERGSDPNVHQILKQEDHRECGWEAWPSGIQELSGRFSQQLPVTSDSQATTGARQEARREKTSHDPKFYLDTNRPSHGSRPAAKSSGGRLMPDRLGGVKGTLSSNDGCSQIHQASRMITGKLATILTGCYLVLAGLPWLMNSASESTIEGILNSPACCRWRSPCRRVSCWF